LDEWCRWIEDADADDAAQLFEQAAVIAATRADLRRMVEKLAALPEPRKLPTR
jgi:hypothetical protein